MTEEISDFQKILQKVNLPTKIEKVILPSGGKFYHDKSCFNGREEVELRPMTTKEEDILSTRTLLENNEVVPVLFNSVLVSSTLNAAHIHELDLNQLFIFLRIISYGHEYPVQYKCSKCSAEAKKDLDLRGILVEDPLDVDSLKHSTYNETKGTFLVELPVTGITLEFYLRTVADDIKMEKEKKRAKRKNLKSQVGLSTEMITSRCLRVISGDSALEDPTEIRQIIEKLHSLDSSFAKKALFEILQHKQRKFEVECDSCGHSEEVALDLSPNFFRSNT